MFSTGMSKAPIFYCVVRRERHDWETWMFQRSAKVALPAPKLARLTMPVLRFGEICLTLENAIFGLWDVCSMKWPLSDLPLWQLTCLPSARKYKLACVTGFLTFTHKIWMRLSVFVWQLLLRSDHLLRGCCTIVWFESNCTVFPMKNSTILFLTVHRGRKNCCRRSSIQERAVRLS